MVTQTLMQRMGLNAFSLHVRLRQYSLNPKLDAEVDVGANADVKCKQSLTAGVKVCTRTDTVTVPNFSPI